MPAVQPGTAIREYYRGNIIDVGYAATLTTLGVEVIHWRDGAGNLRTVHHLYDDEDPNGSTNYDAAPIGSIYTNISTGKQFTKTAASTWETITSS
jgi:hypothetical protein